MADNMAATVFGIRDRKPTLRMIFTVWRVLAKLCQLGKIHDDDAIGLPRPWQPASVRHLYAHPYAELEGARQAEGKSTIVSVCLCCELLLGNRWGIGVPSLKQGSRVIHRKTSNYMELLEPVFELRRRRPDNELEKFWDNGAELMVLSAGESGVGGTQGYTRRGIVIDEKHTILKRHVGFFVPLVSVAVKRNRGHLWTVGVADDSPEHGSPRAFQRLQHTDSVLADWDDRYRASLPAGHPELQEKPWRQTFREAEELLDPDEYNQFYRLISPSAGSRLALPYLRVGAGEEARYGPDSAGRLRGLAEELLPTGLHPRRWGAIDVGQKRDYTVAGVAEQRGTAKNLVAVKRLPIGMPYTEQYRELRSWFREQGVRASDISLEVNGPGQGLYDICADVNAAVPWQVNPVTMTYPLKVALWESINRQMRPQRNGQPPTLGIDPELRLPQLGCIAEHLAALTISFGSAKTGLGNKWDFEATHSDVFSMLLLLEHASSTGVLTV